MLECREEGRREEALARGAASLRCASKVGWAGIESAEDEGRPALRGRGRSTLTDRCEARTLLGGGGGGGAKDRRVM